LGLERALARLPAELAQLAELLGVGAAQLAQRFEAFGARLDLRRGAPGAQFTLSLQALGPRLALDSRALAAALALSLEALGAALSLHLETLARLPALRTEAFELLARDAFPTEPIELALRALRQLAPLDAPVPVGVESLEALPGADALGQARSRQHERRRDRHCPLLAHRMTPAHRMTSLELAWPTIGPPDRPVEPWGRGAVSVPSALLEPSGQPALLASPR
jgi:hypothetical protein